MTAFTIIFVTIMTTVTRRYALYKAQKGAYIADIEQLQASISLPSTIKMVFSLQRFTKVSVILVGLWSFYYTGSQASKREYALAVSNGTHQIIAAYPRTDAAFFIDPNSDTWLGGSSSDLASIFKRWGGDKQKTTGADDDGNILLPDPNFDYSLYANGTVNNTHVVKIIPSVTTYLTPPIGRPLYIEERDVFTSTNGTTEPYSYWSSPRMVGDYQLHTSYTKFHCVSVDVLSADQFPNGLLDVMSMSINMTVSDAPLTQAAKQVQFFLRWSSNDTVYDDNYDLVPAPRINGSDGGMFRITCDVLEPRIIANVHCGESACLITSMSFPVIDNETLRETAFSNLSFAEPFFSNLLLADGVPQSRSLSTEGTVRGYLSLDYYIGSIVNGSLNATNAEDALRIASVGLDTVVNSYINLILRAGVSSSYDLMPGFDTLTILGAPWEPHYRIFWEWIAIDYVAGGCLLAAAIFSFWLRKNTLAPDIFGFVSSLTRDNPHFPVPVGGSTLDGISRTRAFRNVKVKLGDVGGMEDGHGRLGFVPIVTTVPAQTLSRSRKYI